MPQSILNLSVQLTLKILYVHVCSIFIPLCQSPSQHAIWIEEIILHVLHMSLYSISLEYLRMQEYLMISLDPDQIYHKLQLKDLFNLTFTMASQPCVVRTKLVDQQIILCHLNLSMQLCHCCCVPCLKSRRVCLRSIFCHNFCQKSFNIRHKSKTLSFLIVIYCIL